MIYIDPFSEDNAMEAAEAHAMYDDWCDEMEETYAFVDSVFEQPTIIEDDLPF